MTPRKPFALFLLHAVCFCVLVFLPPIRRYWDVFAGVNLAFALLRLGDLFFTEFPIERSPR